MMAYSFIRSAVAVPQSNISVRAVPEYLMPASNEILDWLIHFLSSAVSVPQSNISLEALSNDIFDCGTDTAEPSAIF